MNLNLGLEKKANLFLKSFNFLIYQSRVFPMFFPTATFSPLTFEHLTFASAVLAVIRLLFCSSQPSSEVQQPDAHLNTRVLQGAHTRARRFPGNQVQPSVKQPKMRKTRFSTVTGRICCLQPRPHRQRPGPAASAPLRHHGDREDGGHQQEVQARACVWRRDCELRLPGPEHRPAVPGELHPPPPAHLPPTTTFLQLWC